LVVGPSPALDEDLGFPEGVEDLAVEQLVTQLPVEALDLPVCPGAAGLNDEGLGPNAGQPRAHGPGGELRAVVRAEVGRDARGHHAAVAVAPQARGPPHDGGPEGGFCLGDRRAVPLRGPGLAHDLTRPTR